MSARSIISCLLNFTKLFTGHHKVIIVKQIIIVMRGYIHYSSTSAKSYVLTYFDVSCQTLFHIDRFVSPRQIVFLSNFEKFHFACQRLLCFVKSERQSRKGIRTWKLHVDEGESFSLNWKN